jgi:hypothetical protein
MISDRAIRAALDQFRLAVPAESTPQPTNLQIVLDASLSMTTGDGSKEERARELSIVLLRLSEMAGLRGSVHLLRGIARNRIVDPPDVAKLAHVPFDGIQPLSDAWDIPATDRTASTWRMIISDFLFPGDPLPLVQKAAAGAANLWLVQLLDEWELHPSPSGASSLVDIETEQSVELIVDDAAVKDYLDRLEILKGSIAEACRSTGASWITTSAATALSEFCRRHLVPAGFLAE